MRHTLAFCTVLWAGTLVAADAPKLVRSEPANGAVGVGTDVGVIRFYFDRPMKMNGRTFWMSEKGPFPPMKGAKDSPWRDPQCAELRVQDLKPNTTYAIQLNAKQRKGFRSAQEDVPLPITTVVFTTGPGKAAQAPPAEKATRTPAKAQPAVDGKIAVRRTVLVKGKIHVQGDKAYPMGYSRDLKFVEEAKRTQAGQPVEVVRTLLSTKVQEVDSETGKLSTSTLAPAGTAVKVVFSGQGARAMGVSGTALGEDVTEALTDDALHRLLPDGQLTQGRQWSLEGAELASRFRSLSFQGGRLSCQVVQVSPEVKVTGTLKTKVDLGSSVLDFDATLEMKVAQTSPLLASLTIKGTLSGAGSLASEGRTFPYTQKASAEYSVIVMPASALDKKGDSSVDDARRPKGDVPAGIDPNQMSTDSTYGYEKSNPIRVGAPGGLVNGIRASKIWLSHLRDAQFRPFQVRRVGNVGAGPYGNIVDKYALTDQDGNTVYLFVDCYHADQDWRQVKAPKGMYLQK